MCNLKVLGVLAGEDLSDRALIVWASSADVLLAADGAANRLARLGLRPETVVGDLDSVAAHALWDVGVVHHDGDQELTDCDKLLSLALARSYKSITLAGLEGDLIDHMLAGLTSMARSPLSIRLALRRGLGVVVRPADPARMEVPIGRRVSLAPLTPCSGVSLGGVEWPLVDSELMPGRSLSISNRAVEPYVTATVSAGAALLFAEFRPDEMPRWA